MLEKWKLLHKSFIKFKVTDIIEISILILNLG